MATTPTIPIRTGTSLTATTTTSFNEDAIPLDADPSSTSGLLAERLQAWKHACGYLEEYIGAVEKLHKEQAKEYEKVLKTISKPLREGQHFDPSVGGVAGFFENMRTNTQTLINTNLETEKNIKGSVLPVLDRLHKEIKNKAKELANGVQKGAKEVEKARAATQKHIELLGQNAAAFDATGGRINPQEDPYVLHRGIVHRLHHQVLEENNHRNDLLAVQVNFKAFEDHVLQVMQQAMEAFQQFAGGQAERVAALYADMLGSVQRIPPELEWNSFAERFSDILVDPREPPRDANTLTFPNQQHPSTNPVIEGSLERKSRNKLSWGMQVGYYVVSPSRFLHEFRDADNVRKDPVPELSIYLPDAVIAAPAPGSDRFTIKGKDRSKSVSSKLVGGSELQFKAHSHDEAEKWYYIIRDVAGSAVSSAGATSPVSPLSPTLTSPIGSLKRANTGASLSAAAATTSQSRTPSGSSEKTGLGIITTAGQEAGVTSGTTTLSSKPPALAAAQTAVSRTGTT